MPIYLKAASYIDESGYGAINNINSWSNTPNASPDTAKWKHIFQTNNKTFGRLDTLSKITLIASELVMSQLPSTNPNTGIIFSSETGSLKTDLEFFKTTQTPDGASPTIFSHTLPSTAAANAAIRHGLKGEFKTFVGNNSAQFALTEAAHQISAHSTEDVLLLSANAATEEISGYSQSAAVALLLTAKPSAMNGRNVKLELAQGSTATKASTKLLTKIAKSFLDNSLKPCKIAVVFNKIIYVSPMDTPI